MIKAFIIGISMLVGYFTTVFFSRYISYKISAQEIKRMDNQHFVNFTLKYINGSQAHKNYNESHPVISSLTRLIEIPLIGQFFMDQKVYELALLQHWEAIVYQAPYIVTTPANKYSFEVWYHKAVAECSLGLIQQCEDSVKQVEMVSANKYHKVYTRGLFKYLKNVKSDLKQNQKFAIEI